MAFASPHVVPAAVRLEHAPSPTAKFEELGVIRLQVPQCAHPLLS